jgi:hypothetical protein
MPAPEPIPDLLKAANSASGKAFALWITFLSVGTYLAIAIGTTTDRQLLLANPVKLPLLDVDLPLFAFYGFAPVLFLVLHLYVLMQLYLLARLLRLFDNDLRVADMTDDVRWRVRSQLDKFVFTQSLIGVPQDWIVRWLLRVVVWLSFVVAPLLLLLGFQLRFLPYHSSLVTTVQQGTMLLDLVLLLLLGPKIIRPSAQREQRSRGRTWRLVFAGFCVLVGAISILAGSTWATLRWRLSRQDLWFVNERFVEPDEDKLSKLAVSLSLRGRDLRRGFFMGSDFRKADLSVADLSNAVLSDARLDGVDLRIADLTGAHLMGAKLNNADLTGARLFGASLMGADLTGADLRGTDLGQADLRHATFNGSNLDARNLTQKQLDEACGTGAKVPPLLTLKPCPEPTAR